MAAPPPIQTLRAAAAGISAHLVWQLSAKVASFSIKSVVVRALGPAQFAFVEIRIGLLVTLALLPAIAGFRKVCLRVRHDKHAAALAYLCVVVTLLLSLILGSIAMYADRANAIAWGVVTLSLLVRAFAEPPLVFARRRERYQQSSRARAVSTVLSGLSQTVAVGMITDKRYAAPASSLGHLFYSGCLGVSMYFAAGQEGIPGMSGGQWREYLRKEDVKMTAVAMGEGLLKFVLENGEAIVLDVTCIDPIKGAYKLAGNVASMLARFFSEALEEQAFNVFHRLAPAFREKDGEDKRQMCIKALEMALKAALLVSMLIAVVGPQFSYAFLKVLYGSEWADDTAAVKILNWWFVYLVFMAANGVSEAFVTAAGSTAELGRRNRFFGVWSVVYMVALYVAARIWQAEGVVAVNCVNMSVRTAYSLRFYTGFTGERLGGMKKALPGWGVLVALAAGRWVAKWSEEAVLRRSEMVGDGVGREFLRRVGMHGVSGVVAVGWFVLAVWVFEAQFVAQLRTLRAKKRDE